MAPDDCDADTRDLYRTHCPTCFRMMCFYWRSRIKWACVKHSCLQKKMHTVSEGLLRVGLKLYVDIHTPHRLELVESKEGNMWDQCMWTWNLCSMVHMTLASFWHKGIGKLICWRYSCCISVYCRKLNCSRIVLWCLWRHDNKGICWYIGSILAKPIVIFVRRNQLLFVCAPVLNVPPLYYRYVFIIPWAFHWWHNNCFCMINA